MRAYILIGTEIGKTADVVRGLRRVNGVTTADAVTGPYDAIAVVTAADANEVAKIVMNQIHGLPGIKTTLTCLGVETG